MHLWMSNVRRKQYFSRRIHRRFLNPQTSIPRIRLSLVPTSVFLSFSVLPIMVESTMTVDYCPRWKASGDRVQVHRKTRSTEVSCDFPQGPQIILRRKSFWNSTVFLRTSKQSVHGRASSMSGFSQIPGWK